MSYIKNNKPVTSSLLKSYAFTLLLDSNCPLECTYCLMEYSDKERQNAPTPTKKLVINKVAEVLTNLSKNPNQNISICLCNGEPLLQLNLIKKLLSNIDDCGHIQYEVLSSFRFDKRNNYKQVFLLIDKWLDFFNNKKLKNFYLKWSIHLEYYENSKDVLSHYKKLKQYNVKIIPVIMINKRKDIRTFFFLKKIIPNLEYSLLLNSREENTLIKTLTQSEINILKSIAYIVRKKHIVDRVLQDDWSFTGLTCGGTGADVNAGDVTIGVSSNGELSRCAKSFMYPNETKQHTGNILNMSYEEIVNYIDINVKCGYKKCNLCSSNHVGIENE